MTWWTQPHDITSFKVFQEEGQDQPSLSTTHYPQPSTPEDFSSGPEIIIRNAIHIPSGDTVTYLGDGLFNIGGIKHKCESDYPDAIYNDPLYLVQMTPHEHGWLK